MPIFDFTCRSCKLEFEEMVQRDHRAICPRCGSTRTIKTPGFSRIHGEHKKKWDRQPPTPPTKVYVKK